MDDNVGQGQDDPLDRLIARRPWSRFRLTLLFLCFAVTLLDGLHQQTLGVVGPALLRDISMTSTGLGLLMSASELGFMLGAFALSPLTDRYGRKRMLIWATLAFGGFSIATAFAQSLPLLWTARFATGIGLGCAGPAVVSLVTEYSPSRHRARIATLIWAANPAGAVASALLAGWIVPAYGWQALFLLAGGATVLLAIAMVLAVPESLRFLLLRAPGDPRIARVLRLLGGDPSAIIGDIRPDPADTPVQTVPLRILFTGQNAIFTVSLWASFFFTFMCLVAILTWTVAILGRAGIGIETATIVLAWNSVGGTIGVASAGWAMERLGGARLLLFGFVVGGLAIIGMSQSLDNIPLLTLLAGITGLLIGGNTAGLIALAAGRYPTEVRATGLGWALAAGRLGGASGPLAMGVIASSKLAPPTLLASIAVPAAVAAVAMLPLLRKPSLDAPALLAT